MKKNLRITCLALVIVLLIPIFAGSFVFAAPEDNQGAEPAKGVGTLMLVESDPKDGDEGVQVDNVAIRLTFDKNVTEESLQKGNEKCFEVSGPKGEKFEINVWPNQDDEKVLLITAKRTDEANKPFSPNSDYTLKILKNLAAADGSTLGSDIEITFTTVNTAGSTKIYMLLMVLMVAGMIGMSFISKKRKERAKAEIAGKIKPANPYKMSKEKGISVEEAMEIIAKEKARRDKRLKKAGIDVEKEEKAIKEKLNTKRVKGPRPISAAGSTYKTGRKALAEKKAKEEAARKAKGTTNPKNKGGKSKSKKKKKKR